MPRPRLVHFSRSLLLAVVGVMAASPVRAETKLGGRVVSGRIEAGYQKIAGNTDSAKFDEYRDERQWIADGFFLLEDLRRAHYLRGSFRDAGQKDERYRLEGGRYGRWGVWGFFSELPHNYSNNAFTPYSGTLAADLVLSFPRPVAPGPFDLPAAVDASLRKQSLGFRTLEAEGGGYFKPFQGLEFRTNYRLQNKKGTIFRGGLGQPFAFVGSPLFTFIAADFADFVSPIDERIHEVTGDVHWNGERWSTSFNYTGSIYDNRLGKSITVDSPFVGADFDGASSRWRMAAAPDNSAHSFSLAGSYLLPLDFPARMTSTVSYGLHLQNEDFIPQTINSVFAGTASLIPSKNSLDGHVNTWLGDFRFTARPLPGLNVDAHYRVYDYDNQSDVVRLEATVTNDAVFEDAAPGADRLSVPNSYRKQDADLDLSYRVREDVTLGFGWSWQQWRRSSDREVRRTNEQGPNVSLDYRPASWAQLHADYAFTTRRRTGYDPFNYVDRSFNPALVPEAEEFDVFPELRKYPQADRRRQQANLIGQLLLREDLELSLNAGLDLSRYHNSDFGLTDDQYWHAGADASWSPIPRLRFSAYYTFDDSLAKQRSRERPVVTVGTDDVVVDDPALDWTTRTRERAHNAGANLWVEVVPELLEAEIAYAFQHGKVNTRSGGPNPAAVDFPTIKNQLHVLGPALLWRVNEHLRVRTAYRWEFYQQRDFQRDDIPATIGNNILLSPEVDDYRAHVYSVSVIYEF